MNTNGIRILVADDHHLVRSGIIGLLETIPGFFIVEEASDGRELLNKYFQVKPDLVLSDISMPELSGIDAMKKIRESDKSAKFLFLSIYDGDEYIYQIYSAGGNGLASKSIKKGELIFAIETIHNGGVYFGRDYDQEKLDEIVKKFKGIKEECPQDSPVNLTQRELEVLTLICDGLNSGEIADKLFVSRKTIDTYRGSLMKKMNASTSAQLVISAYRRGLL